MYLATVRGSVVATIKHPSFSGRKLLLVQKLDLNGQPTRTYDVAVDDVQAGPGDTVLVMDEGGSARQVLRDDQAPIRCVIVGIVDDVAFDLPDLSAKAT